MLAHFTFTIEYQKGRNNAATYTLSQVTLKLDTGIVKSILDGVTVGMTDRVDAQDPAVAKVDEDTHRPVHKTAVLARTAKTHIDLHVQLGDCPTGGSNT